MGDIFYKTETGDEGPGKGIAKILETDFYAEKKKMKRISTNNNFFKFFTQEFEKNMAFSLGSRQTNALVNPHST